MPSLPGQRNPYKGREPRCWLRLRFAALDGSLHERDLLADTGSPCAVILANTDLLHLMQAEADPIGTNFGAMAGAWLKLAMPEFAVTGRVAGFGSDQVLRAVQSDSPDFSGIVGLPLLRMFEYGGDEDAFWIRKRK